MGPSEVFCHELHEFKRIETNNSWAFVRIRAIRDEDRQYRFDLARIVGMHTNGNTNAVENTLSFWGIFGPGRFTLAFAIAAGVAALNPQ